MLYLKKNANSRKKHLKIVISKMKVPLENTKLDVVMIEIQNDSNEEFEPQDFGSFVDLNFKLPNEIVIKIYSYLNILDLALCAQISKRMRSLCFHQSLEFSQKFSMVILYKRTRIRNVKELIKLGAYEQAKINYGKIRARKLRLGLILHAHQCRKANNQVSKDIFKMF